MLPRSLCLLAVVLCAATTARAGDFVDTRLTFAIGDDDVRKGAGESTPSSPAANFTPGGQNTQFFDNYETKTSGFDNFTNLVVYKRLDSYFERLVIDAAFAIRLNQNALTQSGVQVFRDESSYLRFSYRPDGWGENDNLQFIGFPLSADRFRLGYSYRISWGGSRMFPTARPAPGMKLQLKKGNLVAYLGAKSALVLNQKISEEETNYALLGGVSYDLLEGLRVEANGGFFQRGVNPKQEVLGAPLQTFGGSAQISYSHGTQVGTSIDFALYRNDPSAPQRFFRPETYPGGLSYTAAAEATYVMTTLADPDQRRAGSTVLQPSAAGDLQFRMKYDFWRFHVTGMLRDLSFLTLNTPSIPPYQALPKNARQTPEFFVAAGADYHIPKLHLTPGIVVGFQQPASFEADSVGDVVGNNPPEASQGRRAMVVREDPSYPDRILLDILPSNCGKNEDEVCRARPILGAKFTLRLDLGDNVSTAGEVYTNYNPNRVRFRDDVYGVAQRTFDDPLQIGFNLLASARF